MTQAQKVKRLRKFMRDFEHQLEVAYHYRRGQNLRKLSKQEKQHVTEAIVCLPAQLHTLNTVQGVFNALFPERKKA